MTRGVLPVPPVVILPIEIIGVLKDCDLSIPLS
jgi:hypothetical protein